MSKPASPLASHSQVSGPGSTTLTVCPAARASLTSGNSQSRLRAKREVNVQAAVRDWLARAQWSKKVRVQVDVDPYSFF